MSQIINTDQSALQNSSNSSTDPNQVIQNALEQLFGGSGSSSSTSSTTSTTDGTDSTANILATAASGTTAPATTSSASTDSTDGDASSTDSTGDTQQSFSQLLEGFGVNPQQFRSDLITALSASGGGSPNSSALFQSFQPGSGVDAVA